MPAWPALWRRPASGSDSARSPSETPGVPRTGLDDYSAASLPVEPRCGAVNRYHGHRDDSQGASVVEGDCIIESAGGPAPGPDPAWSGNLQEDPAPTVNLPRRWPPGCAWRMSRECQIQVERAVAGSGTHRIFGAKAFSTFGEKAPEGDRPRASRPARNNGRARVVFSLFPLGIAAGPTATA